MQCSHYDITYLPKLFSYIFCEGTRDWNCSKHLPWLKNVKSLFILKVQS
jgi:hypothetical protein